MIRLILSVYGVNTEGRVLDNILNVFDNCNYYNQFYYCSYE